MKNYVEKLIENLQEHIPNFQNHFIIEWLSQAECQFDAKLKETSKGLILKKNKSKRHIGAEFFGNTLAEKQVNMFHNMINWHYGYIDTDNQFIANLNYENDYRGAVFG